MISPLGLEPTATLLVGILFACVLTDLTLDIFSVRLSLATHRWQAKLWRTLLSAGQNLGQWMGLQALSSRKGSFFSELVVIQQLTSANGLVISALFSLSLLCFSMSLIWLIPLPWWLAGVLLPIAIAMLFSSHEEWGDVGVALIAWMTLHGLLVVFDQVLRQSGLWIVDVELPVPWLVGFVVFAVIAFQTLAPLLIVLSFFHGLFFFSHFAWALLLVIAHAVLFAFACGRSLRRHRVFLSLFLPGLLQILFAGGLFWALLTWALPGLADALRGDSWLAHWRTSLVYLAIFYLCFLPSALIFYLLLPWRHHSPLRPQRIYFDRLSKVHSLSLQLHFLYELWQQAVKSFREAFYPEARQVAKEQSLWLADKDQAQALCLQLGGARSHSSHVEQILAVYRSLNQLELLGESLEILSPEASASEQQWFAKLHEVVLLQLSNQSPDKAKALLSELEHSSESTFSDEERRAKWTRWAETLQRQSLWPWP